VWDDQKRHRFAELQRREQDGALSEVERGDLAALEDEVLAMESVYLGPATQRLRQQREVMDAQNRRLDALVARKTALVDRLQSFLSDAEAERRAIEGELEAVLAGRQGTQTGG